MVPAFDDWTDQEVLEELDENGEGLTPFEIEFVERITQLLRDGHQLTKPQSAKLRQIAEERT